VCSILPSTFFTSLGVIDAAATLTMALRSSTCGSGSSTRCKLDTGPNVLNCKARMAHERWEEV
jgi:hypothetical protein